MSDNTHKELMLEIIESAVANLQRNEQTINDLNVFPVPDGDTGSNMLATLIAAWNNISDDSETDVEIFDDFARGALLGARGNSGVIVSQIFKGLAEGIKKAGSVSKNNETMKIIFKQMRNYAYAAVSNPVEGTILSIIRVLDENYDRKAKTVREAWKHVNLIVEKAVDNTPNQLPILKESGVVDSGAYGLMVLIQGVVAALERKPLHMKLELTREHQIPKVAILTKADPIKNIGYCTEFILTLRPDKKFSKPKFKKFLTSIGDSLVLIVEDDILKVHVHTKRPGVVFNEAQKYGEFTKIKADNMASQAVSKGHEVIGDQFIITPANQEINEDQLGIVAVSDGKGLSNYFKTLGVDQVVQGGQSMNPSIKEFIDIIEKVPNKNVLLLPNNSNIILTAEGAKKQITDKTVFVLPTKSLQQGIVALMNTSKQMIEFNQFEKDILKSINEIDEAVITKAVRKAKMNNIEVNKNDFISIMNKKIIVSNPNMLQTAKIVIKKFVNNGNELITIIYNHDVSTEQRKILVKWIKDNFKDIELEVKFGGQNIYSLLIFGEK